MSTPWLRLLGMSTTLVLSTLATASPGPVGLAQGTQPQLIYYQFDPAVIPADRTQPVLLQAKVAGSPTRVVFENNTNPSPFQQPGTDLEMRDDGTGGDRIAGDGIYAVTLQVPPLVQGLQADDVFRRFVGFLKTFQGATLSQRVNLFAAIITPDVPRLPVTRIAQDIQYTDYLVNIVDPGFFAGTNFDVARVTRKFYQSFPDEYDFLDIVISPPYIQNRYHFAIKNDVRGIGLELFDGSATYGSSGRLLGITVFPNTTFFDGAEAGYQHELGHQWINFLKVPPLASGIPHWPLSSLASGIMGWTDPVNKQGLEFPCVVVADPSAPNGIRLIPRNGEPVFTDLDLYLMGLLPPERVGEHLVFADQGQARMLFTQVGCNFNIPIVRVKVTDIINVVGKRVPDASSASRRFKVATIVVSKDGLLSEEAMSFYSFFAKRAEETREVSFHVGFVKGTAKPFAISTQGLGTIEARVRVKP